MVWWNEYRDQKWAIIDLTSSMSIPIPTTFGEFKILHSILSFHNSILSHLWSNYICFQKCPDQIVDFVRCKAMRTEQTRLRLCLRQWIHDWIVQGRVNYNLHERRKLLNPITTAFTGMIANFQTNATGVECESPRSVSAVLSAEMYPDSVEVDHPIRDYTQKVIYSLKKGFFLRFL